MRPGLFRPRRLLPVAAFAVAALAAGMAAVWQGDTAEAQSATCANAPFHANVESSAGVAFVDVGAQTATFVCINSAGFPGGSSGPLSANGAYGGGCFFVEGIGTSVAAVYWELPDVRPDCMMIINIDVGTGTAPAASPTTAPTVAPTQAPTQAAPTATPTRSATSAPTAAPTSAAPATPTRSPAPPSTGSGEGPGNTNSVLFVGLGAALLALSGAFVLAHRKL